MSTKAFAESNKNPSQTIVPARGLKPQRRLAPLRQAEEAPTHRERPLRHTSGEPGFGHDFSQVRVHSEQAQSGPASHPVAESCPLGLTSPRYCPFGGACHSCPPRVQAKLTIGQPNDQYEQEADRVADLVMRMPDPPAHRQIEPEEEEEETLQAKPMAGQITPLVQRQVEPEEEEEEEEILQTKRHTGETPEMTSDLDSRIKSLRGSGQPLPESTRAFFEPRFGHDFSHVRVHTDGRSAEAARQINARSFTIGRDVVFAAGQYAPGTPRGQNLIGHELTHVVQQGMATRDTQEPRNIDSSINNHLHPIIQRRDDDKPRTDARGRECPNTVELGVEKPIPAFNKKMFDAGYRTYFGLVTSMKVGPKDSYESCITEVLKVEVNTCGDKGKMAGYEPCSPKKYCMKIGGTKDKGDRFTDTMIPSSPNAFIDRHRTARKFNTLEGSGKKACKVKCLQRYGCGGKEIGRFYVTRNFKAGEFDDRGRKVPITLGTIDKETARTGK